MPENIKATIPSPKIPKIILFTAKLLAFLSPKLATKFAAKLFTTPIKYKIPKREHQMDIDSQQLKLFVPSIQKEIVVYHYGKNQKKILLVHGWSGRGTQLVKIADELLKHGYATISFDAPAHGKSKGNTTLLPEFIESILELEKQFGPFEAAVGHSLGGIALFNSVAKGLKINKLVSIGAADIIADITDDFIKKLELKKGFSSLLCQYFEEKHHISMDSFSAWHSAKKTNLPVLVVHDENDDEVPVSCAYHIYENLPKAELMITHHLGHRKILGDKGVIAKTVEFMK